MAVERHGRACLPSRLTNAAVACTSPSPALQDGQEFLKLLLQCLERFFKDSDGVGGGCMLREHMHACTHAWLHAELSSGMQAAFDRTVLPMDCEVVNTTAVMQTVGAQSFARGTALPHSAASGCCGGPVALAWSCPPSPPGQSCRAAPGTSCASSLLAATPGSPHARCAPPNGWRAEDRERGLALLLLPFTRIAAPCSVTRRVASLCAHSAPLCSTAAGQQIRARRLPAASRATRCVLRLCVRSAAGATPPAPPTSWTFTSCARRSRTSRGWWTAWWVGARGTSGWGRRRRLPRSMGCTPGWRAGHGGGLSSCAGDLRTPPPHTHAHARTHLH